MGASSKYDMSGESILYNEYAYHFMIAGLTDRVYPPWFIKGFAEFFAGIEFKRDGRVVLGATPSFRIAELSYARKVPIRKLLDFDGGADDSNSGYDSFHGQSWVLFHYLLMAPERAGQLAKYQQLLAKGQLALEAAEGAFGDLDRLDEDRESYLKHHTVSTLVVDPTVLNIGPIATRKLHPGEAAMMPTMIKSRVGVPPEEAQHLLPEARKVAALYPEEPAVLAALAEAEFDAGNDDAAIAAADRALGIDPNVINAHIQKGYALARKVRGGALPKESWKDVRGQFVIANRVENDNPIPLVQFYRSYLEQGERPTKNAIGGLEWALKLAPFDASLRWLVVQQMISDERFKDAVQTLAPLAYSPRPGEQTEKARRLLKDVEARLEKGQEPAAGPLSAH
jgi:tetratricopeptide (TPR) repeat protein